MARVKSRVKSQQGAGKNNIRKALMAAQTMNKDGKPEMTFSNNASLSGRGFQCLRVGFCYSGYLVYGEIASTCCN